MKKGCLLIVLSLLVGTAAAGDGGMLLTYRIPFGVEAKAPSWGVAVVRRDRGITNAQPVVFPARGVAINGFLACEQTDETERSRCQTRAVLIVSAVLALEIVLLK